MVTISVIVCLCMFVLVQVLFWIAVRPFLGDETVLFAFLSRNIPSAPSYGVYVSQTIRACSNYKDSMERGIVPTTKLLSQRYQKTKLVATLKKFCGRHHNLVNPYNVAVSIIVADVFANDES